MMMEADFASAAMMRLIVAGLSAQGIAAPLRPPGGARVPRAGKQELLARILSAHGRLAIMKIADALPSMPQEPVLAALTRASDVPDLLNRWQRLEHVSHGRHGILCLPQGGDALRLVHAARSGHAPPTEPETLLVLCVIARHAELLPTTHVALQGQDGRPWRLNNAWHDPGCFGPGGSVVLTYATRLAARPDPAPALAKDLVDRLRGQLSADPLRRWTLEEVAASTGLSPRTLQRRLADQGLSLSRLVAEGRLAVASSLLTKPGGPGLSEIAFLAGYADQAHFTRAFSERAGISPRRYRDAFAGSPPVQA